MCLVGEVKVAEGSELVLEKRWAGMEVMAEMEVLVLLRWIEIGIEMAARDR